MARYLLVGAWLAVPVLGVVEPGSVFDVLSDVGIATGFLWFLDRHDKRINETLRVMRAVESPASGDVGAAAGGE